LHFTVEQAPAPVPNGITYETPEMHPMSSVPLSGVKVLCATNDNDGIEQDESDIMESLGKQTVEFAFLGYFDLFGISCVVEVWVAHLVTLISEVAMNQSPIVSVGQLFCSNFAFCFLLASFYSGYALY
jgi:hypothetical protein